MRAISLLLVVAAAATAADGGNSIARHGNLLIVTAPDGGRADPKLTAALRGRVTIEMVDASLGEVTDFLREASGANIVVDPVLLAEAPMISLHAKDMSLGNVVSWVSRLVDCEVGHVHGALYFAREVKAPKTTKVYDISGLTVGIPDFPGPELAMNQTGGGQGSGIRLIAAPRIEHDPEASADEVVDLIKKQVAPGTWDD